MSIPDNSMEKLPIDHWQNYIKLAELGLLRIDQLFQKAKSLDESGMGPIALDLYKAYVSNSNPKKGIWHFITMAPYNKQIKT